MSIDNCLMIGTCLNINYFQWRLRIKLLYSNQYASASLGRYVNVHFLCKQFLFFLLRQLLVFFNKLMFWEIYLQLNMQKIFKGVNKWVPGKRGGLPQIAFQVCVIPILSYTFSLPWVLYWKKKIEYISLAVKGV